MFSLFMERKKQRGQHRKLKSMFRKIDQFVPFENTDADYEVFKVPSDMFIEHNCTSGKIKTQFCRKWLETTEQFISQKPANITFCKVVALLSIPNLWCSQITIFYDEKYWSEFWSRAGPYQYWTQIPNNISFIQKRNIKTSLTERGYYEKLVDEDYIYNGELWYYGELPDNNA